MRPRILRYLLIPVAAAVVVAAWPKPAEAQRRAVPRHRLVVRGGVYGPIFFDPWYSFGYGYRYPWYRYDYGYPWGYPPYGPYGYYGRYDELNASLRLEVNPRQTEVFVDGFRAGVVDDFDGVFQRLRLRPGEHEITLYLDGYRSVRQNVYLSRGADQKLRLTMVPLPAGEPQEPRPEPAAVQPDDRADDQPDRAPDAEMRPRPGAPIGPGREGAGRGVPPRPLPGNASAFGAVSIRVQPSDAEILIDDEPWTGPATQERLVVELSRGRHHIEVRRDGYQSYTNDVDVRAGETATLNISLPRR